MISKIVINPVTRISGFLEIEVIIDDHIIIDAKSSGMMFRGFEKMLRGRSPLDAIYFTERICGICSTAHSMGAALALERALDVRPTRNAVMVRDFIHGCEFIQNHIRHFFQYTLPDYIKGPHIPPLLDESHRDYRLPEGMNRKIAGYYLEALEYSRLAHKMLAILGGKAPHNHGVFVGGITVNMDIDNWLQVKSILKQIKGFVQKKMMETMNHLAEYYPDYYQNGRGYGHFLSYGCYDTYTEPAITYLKSGVYVNQDFQPFDENHVSESVKYAWYHSDGDKMAPMTEETEPDRDKEDAYSWIKAPRYMGMPMEVGPLARMWLSGLYQKGISTMDRTIARVLETIKIINILEALLERIELEKAPQKEYMIPDQSQGMGLIDTTRGALGHWLMIKEGKLFHYEIITPSSWNLSPRDWKGQYGVVEEALIGTNIQDVSSPVEIGRIVRSFDPCVSCATHVIEAGRYVYTRRIV